MTHHHKAKLNHELVRQCRREAHADPSISMYEWAARTGVSRQAITRALYGLSYKELDVPPLKMFTRPKSRQQHAKYVPKGDKRIRARRYLPGCLSCVNFIAEGPSCAAHKARTHILSFPYKHTKCDYYEEAK